MKTSVSIAINAPKEEVWKAITDFKNCQNYIESILSLEILEEPSDTLLDSNGKNPERCLAKKPLKLCGLPTTQKMTSIKPELKVTALFTSQKWPLKTMERTQN